MVHADWIAIKNEYINTNISQRTLAEKYGISFNTLKGRANKENWAQERKEQHNKITTKTQQKAAEKISDDEADRITNLLTLADDVQEKIGIALGQLTMQADMFGNVHSCEVLDVARLKKLVSALKDVKDIISMDDADGLDRLDAVLDKIEGNI